MDERAQLEFITMYQQANILAAESSLRVQQANTAKHMGNPHGAEIYESEAQELINEAKSINVKMSKMLQKTDETEVPK